MLTKQEFDRAIVKGWRGRGFAVNRLCLPTPAFGEHDSIKNPTHVCAMGAALMGIDGEIRGWMNRWKSLDGIPREIHNKIVDTSNECKTKTEAIRKIKAIEW